MLILFLLDSPFEPETRRIVNEVGVPTAIGFNYLDCFLMIFSFIVDCSQGEGIQIMEGDLN